MEATNNDIKCCGRCDGFNDVCLLDTARAERVIDAACKPQNNMNQTEKIESILTELDNSLSKDSLRIPTDVIPLIRSALIKSYNSGLDASCKPQNNMEKLVILKNGFLEHNKGKNAVFLEALFIAKYEKNPVVLSAMDKYAQNQNSGLIEALTAAVHELELLIPGVDVNVLDQAKKALEKAVNGI